MADKKLYDSEGKQIGSTTIETAPPSKNYYDANGSPIQLNPSGVKQPFGSESYTPQTQGNAETAAPYAGRLAANSLPMGGSVLYGPGGTIGGVALKQILQRINPQLFGQAEDPGFDTVENVVLNDALPGIGGPVASAVGSPVKTITKALMGSGRTEALLRKFPAARTGMVTQLSKQLMGDFSPPTETQILDNAAGQAGQHFDRLAENVRQLMERNPVTQEIPSAVPKPLPPKPELFYKPGTHGKTLSDQSQLALDKWKQETAAITRENALAPKAVDTARGAETARLRGGDIFSDPTESQIQTINNLYGDKTIGESLLKLRDQTGDVTKSQAYKTITGKALGDVTGVQNFKVIAGPQATEQLALNKLLAGSESGISGTKILGELNGKNLEIYKEALRPETYDNFKNLLGEIATQQEKGTADKLLNWAGGKLKFMAPLALAHGTIPTGTGIVGGVALTNSLIAKAMSDPETARLVVEAMRTPAGTAKGNLLSHALAGFLTPNRSIPANLIRGAADIATVPDR